MNASIFGVNSELKNIVDKLQEKSGEDGVAAESLVSFLAKLFPVYFPAVEKKLSIVYFICNTGTYKVLLEGGELKDDLYLEHSSLLGHSTAIESIQKIIRDRTVIHVNSTEECLKHGFEDCGSLIVVPMRINANRSVGAFILQTKSEKRFSENDAHILDVISDRLAVFIRHVNLRQRVEVSREFSKKIALAENLDLKKTYNLSYEYTEKVMNTSNMYIALLDQETKEISFPCFYKKESDSESAQEVVVPSRLFDKDSMNKGRTEYILAMGESILIETRDESVKWYKVPGREEKINDPFASWVGVPIVSQGNRIGVIAVYHKNKDYLYTKEDVGFLQDIASQVSHLLVKVKLEKSKIDILIQEGRLLKASFANDLIHKENNKIGGAMSQIEIAENVIKKAINKKDVSFLEKALKCLSYSSGVLKKHLMEIKSVGTPRRENFFIHEIIHSHLMSVKLQKKLDSVEMSIERTSDDFELYSYKGLIDSLLHSLVENAGEAICDAKNKTLNRGFYISVNTFRDGNFGVIDVKDNAGKISEDVVDSLFKIAVSTKNSDVRNGRGYGLVRAKEVVIGLRGVIELYKNDDSEKVFRVKFPLEENKTRNALVIDNEMIWRETLSYFMSELGFAVSGAEGFESAERILEEMRGEFSAVLLDLSFDESQSGNVDGLGLIEKIKKTNPNSKIFVVSGFSKNAEEYKGDVDLILEKVNGDGSAINFESFSEKIKGLL